MSFLDSAVEIQELGQRNLWVLYGKSGSGKTKIAGTFPKPMLYAKIGDDGANTIARVPGIKGVQLESPKDLKTLVEELLKDKHYITFVADTFSLFVQEWKDQNVIKKKRKMTQQDWGNLATDSEEIIKLLHKLARRKIVVLTCHEAVGTIEGMEDEITPEVRPSVSKGVRTYLEGMANYGIHTTKILKEVTKGNTTKEIVKFAADIGPNPYYWTKLQIDPAIKVPARIINPTYDKFMEVIGAVKEEQ